MESLLQFDQKIISRSEAWTNLPMWRERNWQISGKKTSEMAHLRGRFCFHILKNMAQNISFDISPALTQQVEPEFHWAIFIAISKVIVRSMLAEIRIRPLVFFVLFIMRRKSSTRRECFLYAYLPIDNVRYESVRCSSIFTVNFLSPLFSKFPLEYDK